MKYKNLFKATILALIVLIYSCDDSLKNLGFTIQPDSDRITVGVDSLFIKARTVSVDSLLPNGMYAKTKKPDLGVYKDSIFGTIKSDYVGEFYYPEGNNFPEGAIIDSVKVAIFYNSWKGDSLAPINLSIYEITKNLPVSSQHTKFDPTAYVDISKPLGKTNFTAGNIEVPLSERQQSDYYHRAFVNLPKSIGERILDLSKTIKNLDTDSFKKYFKGLYLTTSFGSGSILRVDHTYLYLHFHYLDKKGSSTKQDTIRTGNMILNTTPEVIQINQIVNKNDKLLEKNDDYAFIKSPAGVFTEIIFPFSEKASKLNNQALNLAKFTVAALPETDSRKYKLDPSPYLLLVNKDDMKEFFEKRKVPDNITSFYAQFDPTTYTYNFGNLSAMVNFYKEKNEGKVIDLTYLLVPIELEISTNSQGQSSIAAVFNQMTPTATTIFKSHEKMKMELIFSNL